DEYERINRELMRELAQIQKLETLGMLAGGIAHDFNNMLTAVLGYTELADEQPGAPHAELVEIRKAVFAAARLARQLLEFSKRADAEPAAVDLGAVLVEIERMLRRSIGERITVRTVVTPGLWKVWMPVAQIEQIIV